MLNNTLSFLIHIVLDFLSLAFLMRCYFQLTKISFAQPIAQLIITLTDFAVKPVRRVVPSLGKLDLTTLLLAYATQCILLLGSLWLKDFPLLLANPLTWSTIFGLALLDLINLSLTFFMYAVLIQAILSWINPYAPIMPLLNQLTTPMLHLCKKAVPPVSNIDLSPLLFIIVVQLLLTTLLLPLKNTFMAML